MSSGCGTPSPVKRKFWCDHEARTLKVGLMGPHCPDLPPLDSPGDCVSRRGDARGGRTLGTGMTDIEFLLSVRQLLISPSRWVQGTVARDRHDVGVDYASPGACKFSLPGALLRVQHITGASCLRVRKYLELEISPREEVSLHHFNDSAGVSHYQIIKLLERVLRSLGHEEPFLEEEDDS